MTAPTIEECLELITQQKNALAYIAWPGPERDHWDRVNKAKETLALTPSSVRESIQVREELVVRLTEALKACAPSWLPSAVRDLRREALALTPDSLAEMVRVREKAVENLEITLMKIQNTVAGHTLKWPIWSWCDDVLGAYRRACGK